MRDRGHPGWWRWLLVVVGIGWAGLNLEGADPATPAGPAAAPAAATTEEQVAQQLRAWFTAHPTGRVYIQLDKPLYQPGETIWFKVSIFETATLKPYAGLGGYNCQLVDPRGAPVVQKRVQFREGAGENDLVVPEGVAGGEYLLKVECPGGPSDERPVIINAYQPPLIKKKLDVLGKAYGAGDRVEAKAEFRRGTGEPLVKKAITAIVQVDGREAQRLELQTDAEGGLLVSFTLPEKIETEDALLTLKVEEGGITEAISRSIPLLLAKLNVDFYPEGGDLVVGLPSRVYFQALKPNGKPAELEGLIVDAQGQTVATAKSYHHGMGRFSFTPEKGVQYELQVKRPVGITRRYALPAAKDDGVVIQAADDFTGQRADGRIVLYTTQERKGVVVVAALREQVVALRTVDLRAGANDVALFPTGGQGVLRITVLDKTLTPLCERLVYRCQGADLRVELKADKDHYLPREQVTLTVRTTLPNGQPVPADLCLAVSDDRVLSYADDKTAHLLTHLYLEKDLPGKIEEPNFYFDPKEEKATFALELLMGTRGWRRFEWQRVQEPTKFQDVRITDQLLQQVAQEYARREARARGAAGGAAMELALGAVAMADAKGGAKLEKMLPPAPGMPPAKPMGAVAAAPPPAAVAPVAGPMPAPVLAPPMEMAAKEMKQGEERQLAAKAEALADAVADKEQAAAWGGKDQLRRADRAWGWALVRQFPEVKYATTATETRNDFRETICWQPRVTTDATGRATVSFFLSDAVTSFRVRAEGGARDGLPGRGELVVDARTPLHLEAKLPVVLSAGDVIELPLRISNETDKELAATGGLNLPKGLTAKAGENPLAEFTVKPQSARTFYLPLTAAAGVGGGTLGFWAKAAGLTDTVARSVTVEPVGFPFKQSFSDTVTTTKSAHVTLPPAMVAGSLDAGVKFYPSPMATMLEGIESLLQEPNGCFEQTSSTTYPNIMVLNYLRSVEANAPEVEKRALDLIRRGYQRLAGYECKQKGYEWFGGDPGHEALTAYGVMEFVDMAKVFDGVDPEMIKRTSQWMLAQRDGQGGFKRNARALDSFGRAAPDVTNAYVVWALSEAQVEGIDRELETVTKHAYEAKNPYLTSLALLALAARQPQAADVKELLGLLEGAKQADGSFKGVGTSITSSSGQYLDIETTSLAILARLRAGRPAAALNDSVQWLVKQRQGGGFGPTQSTVLALKALTTYAIASRVATSDGDVVVRVNGNVAARKHFNKGDQGVIEIAGLASLLKPGANDVDVELLGAKDLPYSLDVSFKTATPVADEACIVRLTTSLAKAKAAMGETVGLSFELRNQSAQGQAMTLVRVGIPAGLTPQLWQLKELREKGVLDFYETTPREVIIYYRSLAPQDVKKVNLDLAAEIPGTYTGIASSAYLYYNPQHKWWNAPLQVQVTR